MSKFDDLPEARRRGLEKMEQVYGFEMTDGPATSSATPPTTSSPTSGTGPGLTDRDRRLLLIGMLRAPGGHDVLTIQIPAAYRNGELDDEDLREIVIFLCHYAGWPIGARVNQVVEETIAKAARRG